MRHAAVSPTQVLILNISSGRMDGLSWTSVVQSTSRGRYSAWRVVLAFQGWCLNLAYQADTNNCADFNPYIIYLPCSCFMEPVVPQPACTWMYVWESVISCFKSMSCHDEDTVFDSEVEMGSMGESGEMGI
ncbi:uncharacterized protein C8Q71DRAFT_721213 [Rhodofomes roseus]|uniref:Uncharacterized protein n=1 Tax=Rhodofomes roseus TaxID=34475 RepID=A0ABQ8KQL5_9APHY|nr:uncharacterized protein C8Q71DRAFT_721213 [Rhodofomes roseus]KAH9840718.1 hypothetical protein C8Q71DRAFT_721213 [Rhodofomes roseus]